MKTSGPLTIAVIPPSTSSDAPSSPSPVSEVALPTLKELAFIDNPKFRGRRAEKEFPANESLLAGDLRSPPTRYRAASSSKASAPLTLACETPLLTPTEEVQLFRRMNYCKYRATHILTKKSLRTRMAYKAIELHDEALRIRDRIIRSNTRLVVSIAKSLVDSHNSFDELFSDGVMSLMQAAEKFDIERGFRFSTYATRAIRRNLYRIATNRRRDQTRFSTGSIDRSSEPAEADRSSVMSEARWDDLQFHLKRMLSSLDARERVIVRARFGLESSREVQTLQGLAKKMGICKERVRQLEKRALDKLRLMASEVKLEDPGA